jgi:type II secretory pathway component GspD/PulD (secretin)
MKSNCDTAEVCTLGTVRIVVAFTLAVALLAPASTAKAQSEESRPGQSKAEPENYQTFYLNNITQQGELNEIMNDLRNMVPHLKAYPVTSKNIISVRGIPEDVELAQKIITDLDRAKKIYRLTYTITDIDGGKRGDAQSFSLIAASGDRTIFKQGSRVPIVTGSFDTANPNAGAETQVQYQDVGVNIEATVTGSVDGLMLKTKVEQSSLSSDQTAGSAKDPVIRQSVLDGVSALTPGKPAVLGSLDFPGTTRKQEIEVAAELVK